VIITDEADCEDLEIHGTIELEPKDIEFTDVIEKKAIEELKKRYSSLLKEFPDLKISLDETNFKDGWIEYHLESTDKGHDDIIPVNVWKRNQGVELIPTPESRVGADIY
jgi:hypothetical protein